MSSLRTPSGLQDVLDEDFSWRLKELADMKSIVRSSNQIMRRTIIRAGIPIIYAHWEGFVKKSAESYVEFVSLQGLKSDDLSDSFVALSLKRHLGEAESTGKAKAFKNVISIMRRKFEEKATFNLSKVIDTESNLGSTVFSNILCAIGVPTRNYETRYNLIDSNLLNTRHKVAHGESFAIEAEVFRTLTDDVIKLLRDVKSDIENAVSLKSYKEVGSSIAT